MPKQPVFIAEHPTAEEISGFHGAGCDTVYLFIEYSQDIPDLITRHESRL